jgi:hypothetical protein
MVELAPEMKSINAAFVTLAAALAPREEGR